MATPASKALPPFMRISNPAAVVSGWPAEMPPDRPITPGRSPARESAPPTCSRAGRIWVLPAGCGGWVETPAVAATSPRTIASPHCLTICLVSLGEDVERRAVRALGDEQRLRNLPHHHLRAVDD